MSILFSGTDLTCFRGGRTVFSRLSFSLRSGGALLLQGPNGSGKSSLLRIMAGFLHPIAGSIQWHDGSIDDEPDIHCQRLHYIGHHDPVKPVLTVRENIEFWATLRNSNCHLDQALKAFDIVHLLDIPGRFLSAGQKRRVNLARLLASPARLWLLDEPTTTLDHKTLERFEESVALHRESGGIVIASAHSVLGFDSPEIIHLEEFQGHESFDEAIY